MEEGGKEGGREGAGGGGREGVEWPKGGRKKKTRFCWMSVYHYQLHK